MNRYGYHPDMTPEEWESVLDELIWTFEYLVDEGRMNPFPDFYEGKKWNFNLEKTPEQKQLFQDWMKKNNELEERSQKGLELFAKYYRHLWD